MDSVTEGKRKMNNENSKNGIGFTGLLQIAFIVLKLCNIIHWSWIWVLSPTWISIIIVTICFVVLVVLIKKER